MKPALLVDRSLRAVEVAGLAVIAVATVVAGVQEVRLMWDNSRVTLADLLLMFIYLEVLAMVGLFYRSGALPVRVPIFIAVVALARYLILDTKELHEWRVLAVAVAMCLLSVAARLLPRGGIDGAPHDTREP
jgi:protein PsiE